MRFTLLLGLLCYTSLAAQLVQFPPPSRGLPTSEFIVVPAFSDTLVRVDLRAKALLDELIFYRQKDAYAAAFQLDYTFTSQSNPRNVFHGLIDKQVPVATYEETNSRAKYAQLQDTLLLPPDNYFLNLRGFSDNGRRELFRFADTLFWDVRQQLTLSYVIALTEDSTLINSQEEFPYGVEAKFYLPAYWPSATAPDSILFYLYRQDADKLIATRVIRAPRREKFLPVPGRLENLSQGRFELHIMGFREGRRTSIVVQPFTVRWFNQPRTLADKQLAISALKAVLSEAEFSSRFSGNDQTEAFANYWKELDPQPETPFNGRMAEFYRRADLAQKYYGGQRWYGWERDRGEVLIRYGEPDRIIDQTLRSDSRGYIAWEYDQAGKRFIFVDDGQKFNLQGIESIGEKNE